MRNLIVIFICIYSSLVYSKEAPILSVRIGKSLRNIFVTGLDLKRRLYFNNDVKTYTGKQTVKFNCETFTTLNREKNKPILLATLESPTGLLSFSSEKYIGLFKVITSPKGDSCDIVNEVPMEDYISSLLTKEMNPNWPIEALKAQAVAARTYALHKMKSQQVTKELGSDAFYDLESSEKHQVGGTFFDVTKKTTEAAEETRGEVLLNSEGGLGPIFFHAKCGGRTLLPERVWNNKESSYASVNCPFCHDLGKKGWDSVISLDRLENFLSWAFEKGYVDERPSGRISSFIMVPDKMDRFTVNFYINERPFIVQKTALRKFFGNILFPSNNFFLKSAGRGILVSGEGLGHGVGMCQTGAFALAMQGWSYKKILAHYFPNHQLKRYY